MGTSYVRQSSLADGDTITAALFNDEYNRLLTAFSYAASSTTGHQHDGTAGEGGNIHTIGDQDFLNKILTTGNTWEFYVEVSSAAVKQLVLQDGALVPHADSDLDLGTSSKYFKDAYIDSITTTGNVGIGGNLTVTGTTTLNGGTLTLGDAATDNVVFGADVNSSIIPNTDSAYDLGSSGQEWRDIYIDGTAYLDAINFNGTAISATAAELNILDGVTSTAAELNILDGVTSTAAELNILDGVTSTAAELNILDGVTSTAAELNILDGVTATTAELNILDGVTSTAAELNILDGVTSTATELNLLDGVTATTAELNILDGVTSTTAELNILDGVTSTTAELNILDGVTATTAELNALDGITAVVGELNALDIGSTAIGTAVASKAVILDANKDYTGIRNFTITGDLTIGGDDLVMGTNTAGHILVADGTNFNPTAVGDLAEISTVANDDVFLAIDTSGGGLKKISRSAVVSGLATSGSAISNVVEDTTPQLGGNLDMNSKDIVTTSNATIDLAPNGTGTVVVRGNNNSGAIVFNCESNSHGQKVYGQPHSAGVTNTLMLPAGADSTLVSLVSTDTLTNKTLTSPKINEDVVVSATATELNLLDGVTATTAELNILDGVTSTAAELNILDGVTSTAAELNILDGVTSTAAELNTLDGITAVVGELNALDLGSTAVGTAIASKAVILDSNKDYTGMRNLTISGELDAGSLDISGDADIDGTLETDALSINGTAVTSTAAELNILDGVTSTAAELNALDGITAVVGELNALDIGSTAVGTAVASKAVILDSNKDYTGVRNLTISGELDAATLDVSGDVDVDGTLETDALSINGTAVTSTAAELNILDGVTSTAAELNILDGVTSTAAELNILDGVTSTASELNILDGVTSTATELNILDGVTATTAELNYLDLATLGSTAASKVVSADANNVVRFTGGIHEEATTVTSSSNATTVNLRTGTNFLHDLTEATTFTFSNPPAEACIWSLKIIQDSTARAITWPSTVDWPAATAPTLTATNNGVDVFVFLTIDGGTIWYGFTAGQAMG